MLATKVVCPFCGKHLKTAKPLAAGHRVLCSGCGRSFLLPPDGAAKTVEPGGVVTAKHGPHSPTAEKLAGVRASLPPAAADAPAPANRRLAVALVLGGLLLLMGTTVGLATYFATHKPSDPPRAQAAPNSSGSTDVPSPAGGADDPVPPAPAAPARSGSRPEPPGPGEPPPLPTPEPEAGGAAWLPPEEQKRVNQAIDKGVEWLKTHQTPQGNWGPPHFHPVGLSALPALTLLECGVRADDARVQKAMQNVRKAIPTLDKTYELALAILFLDRLGDPADEKLIRTCALRLVAGQTPTGGWTYTCRVLTADQERDLLTVLEHTRPTSAMDLFGGGGSAPPAFITQAPPGTPNKGTVGDDSLGSKLLPESTRPLDGNPPAAPRDEKAYKKALDRLPSEVRKLPSLQPPSQAHKLPAHDGSDNSNTQFATLGLSAAQRHKLPLERSLALIVQRFHTSQAPDGRWGYHYQSSPRNAAGTPAMTGAGLLGLAVGLGLAAEHARTTPGPGRFEDPAIEKGFAALGPFLEQPLGAKKPRAKNPNRTLINLYFLWTVERCGVLFNRRQIAGKDWYAWGAELLVDSQNADGTWSAAGYPGSMPIVDTCFALLFLKRANLARDLTKKLEFFMEGKKLH